MINAPYLLFLGDTSDPSYAKTAFGLRDWAPERCAAQLRLGPAVDLGLPDRNIEDAVAEGIRTVVIGVAPPGGGLPDAWLPMLVEALEAGLDVAAGLHTRLNEIGILKSSAERSGARLHDVRVPASDYPVGSGRKRSGKRLLTVGTDCAVGKKYAALAIHKALQGDGLNSTFRATGQTGILIAGDGTPIDAVVADFLSGAAEQLSPDNDPDHWDIIEGQGSLFHPAYAGVTTGLVHGSQPDAMVLCDEFGKDEIYEYPGYRIPPLSEVMNAYVDVARLTNKHARFVGAAFNTSKLQIDDARAWLGEKSDQLGLPCTDPYRFGVETLVRQIA
jgi:uncharacterized NAD-dependent epimerase/dehydratase family protein